MKTEVTQKRKKVMNDIREKGRKRMKLPEKGEGYAVANAISKQLFD